MTGTNLLRSLRSLSVRPKPSTGAALNDANVPNDIFKLVKRKRDGVRPCRARPMCKKIVRNVLIVPDRASAGFAANDDRTKRTQRER